MRPIDDFYYLAGNQVILDNLGLTQLYLPIIGADAAQLYSYFLAFNDQGHSKHKFAEILNHLQFGMNRLEDAIHFLTAIDLLVLYQDQSSYYLKLRGLLSREDFLANPIYRRLLEQKIGQIAVQELDLKLPVHARDISKNFSDIFGRAEAGTKSQSTSKVDFDLENFQRLMNKDGLSFKDQQSDVLAIYSLADHYQLTWFDTYQLAKRTAINGQISPQRMQLAKEQAGKEQSDQQSLTNLTDPEKALVKNAKGMTARQFLQAIKQQRRAVIIASEQKLLDELAQMGFLDEVINVMVLYTLNKTKSANLNKAYLMKIANDFAYKKVSRAEDAVMLMRSFNERKQTASKKDKATKSNVPDWSNKEFKQTATAEEAAKLEALKRSMLEE